MFEINSATGGGGDGSGGKGGAEAFDAWRGGVRLSPILVGLSALQLDQQASFKCGLDRQYIEVFLF